MIHHFPEGTLEYYKPENTQGLVIILGQFMHDDPHTPVHKGVHTNLVDVFQNSASNVLYINLHGRDVPLTELQNTIGNFAAKHQNLSIVSAIHGFQVLPGHAHESFYRPKLSFGSQYLSVESVEPASYLLGSYIKSEDYIKTIALAVGEKAVELWYCACQGNKLIPVMQEALPSGSIVFTDTSGFSSAPEFLISALINTLQTGQSFSLDLLFKQYSYQDSYDSFHLEPIRTVIGKDSTNLARLADTTLNDITLSTLKLSYCKHESVECSNNLDLIGSLLAQGKTVSSCTTHAGEHSWLAYAITEFFNGDHYEVSEDCIARHNPELYMRAVGLAAASIEHVS